MRVFFQLTSIGFLLSLAPSFAHARTPLAPAKVRDLRSEATKAIGETLGIARLREPAIYVQEGAEFLAGTMNPGEILVERSALVVLSKLPQSLLPDAGGLKRPNVYVGYEHGFYGSKSVKLMVFHRQLKADKDGRIDWSSTTGKEILLETNKLVAKIPSDRLRIGPNRLEFILNQVAEWRRRFPKAEILLETGDTDMAPIRIEARSSDPRLLLEIYRALQSDSLAPSFEVLRFEPADFYADHIELFAPARFLTKDRSGSISVEEIRVHPGHLAKQGYAVDCPRAGICDPLLSRR